MEVAYKEKIMNFSNMNIASILEDKKEIWFFENLRQALCRLNLKTKEVMIEYFFQEIDYLFVGKIFKYKKKIFLFSLDGLRVVVYDLKTKKAYEIKGLFNEYNKLEKRHVSIYVKKDKNVFIFPVEMICKENRLIIITFNLETETFSNVVIEPGNEKITEKFCCFAYPSEKDSIINGAFINSNTYININLNTQKYELNHINLDDIHLSSCCRDESGFWMTQDDNASIIHILPTEDKEIRYISVEGVTNKQPYSHIYCLSKYIIALPRYSEKVVLIEKNSEQVFAISINNSIQNTMSQGASKCVTCIEYKEKIYLFPLAMHVGSVVNIKKMEAEPFIMWCEEKKILPVFSNNFIYYQEDELIKLQKLIKVIKNNDYKTRQMISLKKQFVGGKIYQEV